MYAGMLLIFQCTCCRIIQIYLLIDHDTLLSLVPQNLPWKKSFCMLLVHICNSLHSQITVEFLFLWQWHFVESLQTICALILIKTSLQHHTKFVNIFIAESECIFKSFAKSSWTLFHKFIIILFHCNLHTSMFLWCLWLSHIQNQTYNHLYGVYYIVNKIYFISYFLAVFIFLFYWHWKAYVILSISPKDSNCPSNVSASYLIKKWYS